MRKLLKRIGHINFVRSAWEGNRASIIIGAIFAVLIFFNSLTDDKKSDLVTKNFNDDLLLKEGKLLTDNGKIFYGQKEQYISKQYKKLSQDYQKLQSEVLKLKNSLDVDKNGVSLNGSGKHKTNKSRSKEADKQLSDSVKTAYSSTIGRKRRSNRKRGRRKEVRRPKTAVGTFPVSFRERKERTIRIPATSHMRGTLLTGGHVKQLQRSSGDLRVPMLIQLDYGVILANDYKLVDLAGCYLLAKSNGNRANARVMLQTTKMTCIGKTGVLYEGPAKGYVTGDDNNFGIQGEIDDFNRNRKLSMAFLASSIGGISSAFRQASSTIKETPLGGSIIGVNPGNVAKTAISGGLGTAFSGLASWYLSEIQDIAPQVVINSGAKIDIILTSGIDLPEKYFKGRDEDENFYSNLLF